MNKFILIFLLFSSVNDVNSTLIQNSQVQVQQEVNNDAYFFGNQVKIISSCAISNVANVRNIYAGPVGWVWSTIGTGICVYEKQGREVDFIKETARDTAINNVFDIAITGPITKYIGKLRAFSNTKRIIGGRTIKGLLFWGRNEINERVSEGENRETSGSREKKEL